jgi:hypothetical protein
MRIRNLKWREIPMWPPEWSILEDEAGEKGILEYVQLRNDLTPRLISVVAHHLGETRQGIIVLEDPAHLEKLYRKLQANLGRTLTEIGDLEIELLPSLPKRPLKQVRPHRAPGNLGRVLNKK